MPRRATIHCVSIRSSLVNLPISIYGPLLERSIRPQSLAIHLSLVSNPKIEAYVGWTGMASASSLAQFSSAAGSDNRYETIEIDPQYAEGLGFPQGELVDIGLLHNLGTATTVGTEPVSSDDWQIIEIHASHVESTLLSQVRVAKVGQEIDVWVLGRTRVRLKIVSLDPPSTTNALLLTTDTEVSIAPKPSKRKEIQPNPLEKSQVEGSPKSYSHVLRVLPSGLFSKTAAKLQLPTSSFAGTIAYVSQATFADMVGPQLQSEVLDSSQIYRIDVKRLSPPLHPSASNEPPPTEPSAMMLHPHSSKEAIGSNFEPEIYLNWDDAMPRDHLVWSNVPQGYEDWDLVRIAVNTHSNRSTEGTFHAGELPIDISRPKISILAGVDDILDHCFDFCLTSLGIHASTNLVQGASAMLLTGRSGAGKTSIAKYIAKKAQEEPTVYAYTLYVDFASYVNEPIAKLRLLLQYWQDTAEFHRPAIVIFDNIDRVLAAEVEHADSFRSRHITELFLSLYASPSRSTSRNLRGILLICTAVSVVSIHPLLNNTHIFQQTIHVKAPNKDARRDILASIVQRRLEMASNILIDPEHPLNYAALAANTEGYSPIDLQDLVTRAMHQLAIRASNAQQRDKMSLTHGDFETAQVGFVPFSLRDVKLETSGVAWSDIGGLHETKRFLRETLEWPTKYGPIFAQAPLRLRSGLLLYGYPGCGKTLLASAIAKECGLNFISVKGPELLNKYIGASEKSVRDLFERASAAKPCILFFDEFDSIAPKRGHDSTGVTDRVVNQMLTQMDGAEGLEGVYVLAATSRPDLIDSALLRPGRLDKSLLCDMPNYQERKEILHAVSLKVHLSGLVDFDEIAAQTEGYSGADLQALIYNAHLEAIHEAIDALPNGIDVGASLNDKDAAHFEHTNFGGEDSQEVLSKAEQSALQKRLLQIHTSTRRFSTGSRTTAASSRGIQEHVITARHMKKVLKTTKSSVSATEIARLRRIYQAFMSDRDGEMPDPTGPSGIGNRVTLG